MLLLVEVSEGKINTCKRRMEEGYGSWYDEVISNGVPSIHDPKVINDLSNEIFSELYEKGWEDKSGNVVICIDIALKTVNKILKQFKKKPKRGELD